ncbi:hypothetical protein QZH41_003878 [Actinostola sp. cb2023]|nr:hypothetical protein QZH41_003878 [Actinostola sp. cb2023]
MVADMRQSVYYQKCHDPECKRINYKSQEKPIPDDINPFSLETHFLDSGLWEDEQEDDDILCRVAEQAENQENLTENERTQGDNSAENDDEFASFFDDDDSNWEPWKDLPFCDESTSG